MHLAAEWGSPEVIVAIVAAVISVGAVVLSVRQWVDQSRLAQQQLALQNQQIAIQAQQTSLQNKFNQSEALFEQRRFITVLWDRMSAVHRIDPANPVAVHVREDLDTLELVSLCWSAGIVDKRMVVIAFGRLFVVVVDQIRQIHQPLAGYGRAGPELLAEHPAITACLAEIQQTMNQQGVV